MTATSFTPSERLKPFVSAFLFIESEQGEVNRLLPDTSVVMAFRLSGIVSDNGPIPASAITGLRRSVRFVTYAAQTSTLLVIFKPGGASAFFKEPLHELFGLSLPLDYMISRGRLQQVEEQLHSAGDNFQRVKLVEDLLLSILNDRGIDPLVNHAIGLIRSTKGNIKIRSLADDLSLSIDPFEKRFRRITGISPKQFAANTRLRDVIRHYSASESLTSIALKSGYFDQAHFIKDFHTFTGFGPQQFFKSATWW